MLKVSALSIAILLFLSPAHSQSKDETAMDHSTMDHAAHMKMMADSQRQAQVSELGKDVMPFSLSATVHIFSTTAQGSIQRVKVKKSGDKVQVRKIRQHLQEIREQFLKGDFSGPTHIHGQKMPGLAELQAAKPGAISIEYKDVAGGAELRYRTMKPSLVAALHKWFDAQLSDHGKDAVEGHDHPDDMKSLNLKNMK